MGREILALKGRGGGVAVGLVCSAGCGPWCESKVSVLTVLGAFCSRAIV